MSHHHLALTSHHAQRKGRPQTVLRHFTEVEDTSDCQLSFDVWKYVYSTFFDMYLKTPILRPFPSPTPRKDTYVQRGQRTSALHRGWRLLRAELRGALLVFHLPGDMRTAGVDGISNMYDAALLRHGFARAVHHNKRPHVFELVLMNGREMLVQARLVPVSNAFLYSATNDSSSRHVM